MEKLPAPKLKQQKSNLSEHNFILRNLQPQMCYLFVPDTSLSLAHNKYTILDSVLPTLSIPTSASTLIATLKHQPSSPILKE